MERAVDWLFSHPDDAGDVDADVAGAPAGGKFNSAVPSAHLPSEFDVLWSDNVIAPAIPDAGRREAIPKYRLHAYVTHKGTSVHCGHYVAHVRMDDGRWAFFNDEKVADHGDAPAPGQGYLYFFVRTS
eukprot:Opistho-1_new@88513